MAFDLRSRDWAGRGVLTVWGCTCCRVDCPYTACPGNIVIDITGMSFVDVEQREQMGRKGRRYVSGREVGGYGWGHRVRARRRSYQCHFICTRWSLPGRQGGLEGQGQREAWGSAVSIAAWITLRGAASCSACWDGRLLGGSSEGLGMFLLPAADLP